MLEQGLNPLEDLSSSAQDKARSISHLKLNEEVLLEDKDIEMVTSPSYAKMNILLNEKKGEASKASSHASIQQDQLSDEEKNNPDNNPEPIIIEE